MAGKIEQFSELQRKNMEAAMRLAQLSIENSQRIMALQTELAKEMFQSGELKQLLTDKGVLVAA